MDINKAREIVNNVDKEMAHLFEKRMEAVKEIAEYKNSHGLQIFDKAREAEVVAKNTALIENPELRSYYVSFIQNLMDTSKKYQHSLMHGMKVAYSGVSGAFAQLAAQTVFDGCSAIPYSSFETAYEAVKNGECDCAVLPIENSFAGDVGAVMDLAYFGTLYISGVYDLPVTQELMANPGVDISEIKEVISHPQALSQCGKFISKHNLKTTEVVNTAVAAKMVKESNRRDIAALGSANAAEIYGLDILQNHVNDSDSNSTRFAVFTRDAKDPTPKDDHFIMVFTVNNHTGSLCKALSVIGEYGINLISLKSRPTKELIWDNYFFVEGEGNLNSLGGENLIIDLKKYCNTLKVLGSFKRKHSYEDKK